MLEDPPSDREMGGVCHAKRLPSSGDGSGLRPPTTVWGRLGPFGAVWGYLGEQVYACLSSVGPREGRRSLSEARQDSVGEVARLRLGFMRQAARWSASASKGNDQREPREAEKASGAPRSKNEPEMRHPTNRIDASWRSAGTVNWALGRGAARARKGHQGAQEQKWVRNGPSDR